MIEATPRKFKGPLAEWLGSGLQNRVHQFKSGTDLKVFQEINGRMMKLVYIRHLKCRVIYGMRVRVPLRPPKKKIKTGLERAETKQDNF